MPYQFCDYSEWRATRVLIPAVYLLAFVAGTLGNGLVLTSRSSRSVTESLIASLALADLVFVTTLPLWAVYTALDYHWPFGSVLCRISSYLVALNMYASVFSLTSLSVERYCVIVQGRNSNGARSRAAARARQVVGGVWTAACVLALPALLLRTVREGEAGATHCLCDMDYSSVVSADLDPATREQAELLWSTVLGLKSTLLGFLLPLTVLLLCYCSLGRLLSQHFSLGPRPDRPRQRRLLRVITSLVLAFFLCWLPFHTNKTLSALVELGFLPYSCDFDQWLMGAHPYAICLGYANSCLNPLLYTCCDPAFRRYCRAVAHRICRQQGRESPSKSSVIQSGTKGETEEESTKVYCLEGL
uniref:G-protein coupled receptors family 1 profile domain-containing protein n=1 Tax=Electrophorus electricus TaxID=8005 RepID=A0A4W4FVW1_ELEEL